MGEKNPPFWPFALRKMQCYERHEVEKQYSDLVDRDPAVMDRVERLDRDLKPPAVHSVEPIVCKDKSAKPNKQHRVVDDRTPDQDV